MYHTRLGLLGTLYPIQINSQYETAFSFSRGGSFKQGIDPADNGITRRRGRYAFRARADPLRAALINVWQVPVQRPSRLAQGSRYWKKH